MTKKTLFSILATGILMVLTGCSTLSSKNPFLLQIKDPSKHLTEHKNSIFPTLALSDKKKSYGLKILADQVLGVNHGCSNIPEPKIDDKPPSQPKYYDFRRNKEENKDRNPLSSEMAKADTMKILMKSQCDSDGDLAVGYFDMHEFIEAMHIEYVRAYADGDVPSAPKDELVFSKVLLTYAKSYYKGEFVLRDGTKLAKPSSVIGFNKDGVFIISTDNDTLTGFTTVFLEALAEFAFPTKIIVDATKTPIYEKEYREIKKSTKISSKSITAKSEEDRCNPKKPLEVKDEREDIFCELFYKRTDTTNYLTNSNLKPTVQTLNSAYFNNSVELVASGHVGISKIELDAMRFISSNVADGSKMVLGTSLRSAGGIGLSLGAFGKASIGDNDAFMKIVETAIEVLSRRLLEYKLYHFLMDHSFENKLAPFFGD